MKTGRAQCGPKISQAMPGVNASRGRTLPRAAPFGASPPPRRPQPTPTLEGILKRLCLIGGTAGRIILRRKPCLTRARRSVPHIHINHGRPFGHIRLQGLQHCATRRAGRRARSRRFTIARSPITALASRSSRFWRTSSCVAQSLWARSPKPWNSTARRSPEIWRRSRARNGCRAGLQPRTVARASSARRRRGAQRSLPPTQPGGRRRTKSPARCAAMTSRCF